MEIQKAQRMNTQTAFTVTLPVRQIPQTQVSCTSRMVMNCNVLGCVMQVPSCFFFWPTWTGISLVTMKLPAYESVGTRLPQVVLASKGMTETVHPSGISSPLEQLQALHRHYGAHFQNLRPSFVGGGLFEAHPACSNHLFLQQHRQEPIQTALNIPFQWDQSCH